MEQEEWRPVVGYEGSYEVSNLGRVKSLNYNHTGKEDMLKLSPNDKGYLQVKLYKNGEKSIRKVHQLVMMAFVGKCPTGHEIDHYDWNPTNNRLSNLSYQPNEVNRARRSPEGLQNVSEAAKKRAKPVDQYTLDGIFVKTWKSTREIEMELGINHSHISRCCNDKRKTAGGFIWKFSKEAV